MASAEMIKQQMQNQIRVIDEKLVGNVTLSWSDLYILSDPVAGPEFLNVLPSKNTSTIYTSSLIQKRQEFG